MNITCPNCTSENAFHNGVGYECPDCDHEWDDDTEDEDFDDDDEPFDDTDEDEIIEPEDEDL